MLIEVAEELKIHVHRSGVMVCIGKFDECKWMTAIFIYRRTSLFESSREQHAPRVGRHRLAMMCLTIVDMRFAVVGMTSVPECILARELGIPYAAVALSTDYDCWKDDAETVSCGRRH